MDLSAAPDAERFEAGIQAHEEHATRVTKARRFARISLIASLVLFIAAAIAWLLR